MRDEGDWEGWLAFFLEGVAETAQGAFEAATRIVDLFKADRERIAEHSPRAGSVLRVHEDMQANPFVTAPALGDRTRLSPPTVNAALADLERLGIAEEVTGRRRGARVRLRPVPRDPGGGDQPARVVSREVRSARLAVGSEFVGHGAAPCSRDRQAPRRSSPLCC